MMNSAGALTESMFYYFRLEDRRFPKHPAPSLSISHDRSELQCASS